MPAIFEETTLSLDSVDSTTSTAQTITAPATVNAGDLLLLFDFSANYSGTPTNVVPTGFTQINTDTSSNTRTTISYKIAAGTEGGSTITGMTGNFGDDKVCLRIAPNMAIATITSGSINSEVTDGDPASQNCTAASGTPPLAVFAQYGGYDDISGQTRTFSPAADAEVNSSAYHYVKYKIWNASPSDTTIDMGDAGLDNVLVSFYLEAS